MTGQAYEAAIDLHLNRCPSVAASLVVTGQNQSLVLFLIVSVEETGQNLKLHLSGVFFVEVTGQSRNRACSETSLVVVSDDDQVNVFYSRTMSPAFFWQEMNLTSKEQGVKISKS